MKPPDRSLDYTRVVVVIPALNEAESLPSVLADLPQVGAVIVVDNGSSDGTADVARQHGAIAIAEPRRGYGNACLAGISRAADLEPSVLVILDGDYSDHPDELPLLVDPVLLGLADMVLGDRTKCAEPGALLPNQRFGNALATRLIARVCGHRYADMGPFRAIGWDALQRLEMIDPTWGWNVEMQLKAVQRGLRVREVPVNYRKRVGHSKISGTVRGTLRAGYRIIWAVRHYAA